MNLAKSRWLFALALVGLQLAACHKGSGGGAGNTGGSGALGPGPQAVPLRRLTNDEYSAATAGLFPGYAVPPSTFIADTKTLNFLNISSSQNASRVRMEQYQAAAEQIALGDTQVPQVWTGVAADPTKLTGCDVSVMGETACAQPYLYDLVKRAYRRPVTDAEKAALWQLFSNPAGGDYKTRLAMAIEGVLISPHFIFRPELGDATRIVSDGVIELSPWEVATRLSFFLEGSTPDAELTAAADAGGLRTTSDVAAQARRLLQQPAAQANMVKMHQEWLGIDTVSALTKDPTAWPQFTPVLAVEMGLETKAFVNDIMFAQGGTFNDLLLSPYTFANADIAAFYGLPAPATDWARLDLDPTQRRGLLTQPSLLATLAKDQVQDLGTAIKRGKFVLQQILCRAVQPPTPDIIAMFPGPLDLTKTARDQAKVHESNAICAACHTAIDGLGLPFEHYDLIGEWRNDDGGKPLDVTGDIDGVAFNGVPDMAQKLAVMPEAQACYLQQWFQFSMGKLVGSADQAYLDWLGTQFTPDTKLVDLVVDVVTSNSFRQLKVDPTAGSGS
jgi:hypothetical protein